MDTDGTLHYHLHDCSALCEASPEVLPKSCSESLFVAPYRSFSLLLRSLQRKSPCKAIFGISDLVVASSAMQGYFSHLGTTDFGVLWGLLGPFTPSERDSLCTAK